MLSVVYSDADLAVVVKPAGVLSEEHETKPNMPQLLREALGLSPDAYVGTVHRLDRQVGGLMVYALKREITGELSAALAEREAGKEYIACLTNPPEGESATLCDLLYYDRGKNKSYVVKRQRNGVKRAELSYTVLGTNEEGTWVRIRLFTGRTHQIRVQFASRGCSLVGDARYGGGKGDPLLYAFRLTFRHPHTKKTVSFFSLPEWAREWEEALSKVPHCQEDNL